MTANQMVALDQFISHSGKYLTEIKTNRNPIFLVKDNQPVAVLQDVALYQKFMDALLMLKLIQQGEKDIATGNVRPQAEVFASLTALLETKDE